MKQDPKEYYEECVAAIADNSNRLTYEDYDHFNSTTLHGYSCPIFLQIGLKAFIAAIKDPNETDPSKLTICDIGTIAYISGDQLTFMADVVIDTPEKVHLVDAIEKFLVPVGAILGRGKAITLQQYCKEIVATRYSGPKQMITTNWQLVGDGEWMVRLCNKFDPDHKVYLTFINGVAIPTLLTVKDGESFLELPLSGSSQVLEFAKPTVIRTIDVMTPEMEAQVRGNYNTRTDAELWGTTTE